MSLYITEFAGSPYQGGSPLPMASLEGIIAEQTAIVTSGTSQQSSAFGTRTTFIRLITDDICHIAYGSSPTAATTSTIKMAAGQTEYFAVKAGQKIAVILGS